MISGSWTTKLLENQNGLTQAVGGIKQPYTMATLASNYAGTSTTYIAVGMSAAITATDTLIEVIGSLTVNNSAAGIGIGLALYRTTGTAPNAGAAFGGGDTKVWENIATHPTASTNIGVGFDFVDTGLTAGTTYTYYITWKMASGTPALIGNATFANASTFYVQNI